LTPFKYLKKGKKHIFNQRKNKKDKKNQLGIILRRNIEKMIEICSIIKT
jgi:hypothetical protein